MKPLNFVNSFDPYAARLEETKKRRRRLIAAVSLAALLLLALLLGIGIGVSSARSRSRENKASSQSSSQQQQQNDEPGSLLSVCNRTAFPPSCVSSLSSHPEAPTANPKKLALIGIQVGVEEVRRSLALVHNITTELEALASLVNLTTMDTLEDCSNNYLDAVDYLEQSTAELDIANIKDFRGFKVSMENVHTWLSSALTFHTTCGDAIENKQDRLSALIARSEYVRQVLTNTLSFFVPFKAALSNNIPTKRRKLLQFEHQGMQTELLFPDWLPSSKGRHLLQQGGPANAIVSKDGSGQFVSIQEAVDAAPLKSQTMHVIYIKQGIYDESVVVPKAVTNLAFVGDGIDKTIIQGQKSVAGGSTTFGSATIAINGKGFVASHLSVRNLAGPNGRQAVAIRVSADRAAFYRCSFNGYQDTLYAHSGRQFYRECLVSGTVDFVFGNAAAVFQRCNIQALLPNPGQKIMVTAHGRVTNLQNTAFSFQSCRVEGSGRLLAQSYKFPAFLGRPWKDYATTVFMQSEIAGIIHPAGWSEWEGAPVHRYRTVFFGEYLNVGLGAAHPGRRVYWSTPSLTVDQAREFTVGNLISGLDWLPYSGIVFANNL